MKRLHNLSYKFLFTILFLALAGIVFFLKIGGKTQKVSAAWWNDSWHYRQSINISSHTSLESNVYITTAINIGSTTKAQIDDGDFRFISQSGENLSYYIVSGAGTTNISFHILIPSFPANTSTIYAYYGNSTIENGFSAADFSTQASNYTVGSLSSEEVGGGPIAYWKFDEGVGTTINDSIGNKNGTFSTGTSSPSWISEDQCISGKCLLFDGNNNQSISLANTISSNSNIRSQGLTVETWVKLTDSNKEMRVITQSISSGYSDIASGGIGIRSTNKASFIAYDDSGSYRYQDSNTTLQTNQWYFIVGTFNPSDLKMNIYVNGKLDSSSTVTATLFSRLVNNDYNKIGTIYQNGSNKQFFGYIDESKIYPYARTPDQIKQDYNSRGTLSGSSANLGIQSSTAPDLNSSLVAHYKFDENSGTTVYDSINSATGTVYNGATWMRTNLGIGLSLGGAGSNDYISLSNQPLNNATVWSISTKIKYINLARGFEFFLGQNDQTTGKILLRHNGYISFRGINGTYYDFSTTSAEINNLDSNLLFVSNGTTIKLYINGIYKSSITPGSTSMSINIIGNAWTDTVWTSAFVINELKIYNTALTDEQIKQDYNGGSAIQFGSTNQTIGDTTTSLDYCIPGDTSYCAPPVAEWKMDEGVGTSIIDTSGNSNTGTFGAGSSAPTWAQGKIGNGLSFNGTSNFINTSISSVPTTFTMSSWIKLNTLGREQHFIEFNGTQFYVSSSNKLGTSNWSNAAGTTTLTTNKWYYATLTRDSSEIKLYLNGVFEGVGTSGANPTSPFVIGDFYSHSGNYKFSGSIDHVKIYNYVRTPAQVAYDYNRGGPVGWWKMDECQGSTIYDWSGNGNNGTLTIGSNGTQNSIGTCQIGTSAAWTNGATGKLNSSLNFDGTDDYNSIPNNNSLNLTETGGAVSVWFKTNVNATGSVNGSLVAKTNTYTNGYWFTKYNNKLRISLYGTSNLEMVGNKIITDNLWHHAVATWTPNILSIYIDGVLDKSQGYSFTFSTASQPLYIARMLNTGEGYFSGQIDDVRIYNYALTPDQIKQVYNGGAISFN